MKAIVLALFLVACGKPVDQPAPTPPAHFEADAPDAPPAKEPAPTEAQAPEDGVPSEEEAPAAEEAPADEEAPTEAPEAETGTVPDGGSCLKAEDCENGICEGEGCTDDKPGTCMGKMRRCTRDRRPFCGCDGETFWGSGTCQNVRYETTGTCEKE